MGKIKRGNYIFITWIGDHSPKHVHVYKQGKFVCKWDLDNNMLMSGKKDSQATKIIIELVSEGKL